MLSSLYGFWYSDYNKELEQITKQRKLRHLLHKQINLSNVKLKKIITCEKLGIWEIEKLKKQSIIPVEKIEKKNINHGNDMINELKIKLKKKKKC